MTPRNRLRLGLRAWIRRLFRTPASALEGATFAVGDIVEGVANAYDGLGELSIEVGARYRVTGLPGDGKLNLIPLAGGAPRSAWQQALFRRVNLRNDQPKENRSDP